MLPISINYEAPVQLHSSPLGESEHKRQVVIDLGRPGLSYRLEIRDLIHWTAYRLDTGADGYIINRRTAATLRSIAERFYPHVRDETNDVVDELIDEGLGHDLKIEEMEPVLFDPRLLGLIDGMAFVTTTISDLRLTVEKPGSVLWRNAEATIDIEFPAAAEEMHGIRGIRLYAVDLIWWLAEGEHLSALSLADEAAWLNELEVALHRSATANGGRWERLNGELPANAVSGSAGSRLGPSLSTEDKAALLAELHALG